MFGSTACPSSSASSEFCSVGKPSTVSLCCSSRCRNGDGWPEPCPEDHCWESLLSCHSRCSASGKICCHNFLKIVLEEGAATNSELLCLQCLCSNSMCFYCILQVLNIAVKLLSGDPDTYSRFFFFGPNLARLEFPEIWLLVHFSQITVWCSARDKHLCFQDSSSSSV